MSRYQVLSIGDDESHCECCGKQGLKRVVFIEDTETNEIKHFGTTCAMAPAKGFGLEKEVKEAIKKFDAEQQMFWLRFHAEYRKRGGKHVADPSRKGYFIADNPELKNAIIAELKGK